MHHVIKISPKKRGPTSFFPCTTILQESPSSSIYNYYLRLKYVDYLPEKKAIRWIKLRQSWKKLKMLAEKSSKNYLWQKLFHSSGIFYSLSDAADAVDAVSNDVQYQQRFRPNCTAKCPKNKLIVILITSWYNSCNSWYWDIERVYLWIRQREYRTQQE